MQGLYRWTYKKAGIAETVRKLPAALGPPTSAPPLVLPSASDVLALAAPPANVGPAEPPTDVAMQLGAVAHNVILSGVKRACAQAGTDEVPFDSLVGLHIQAVETLAKMGALTLREDESGVLMVGRNAARIMDIGAQLLGDPRQVIQIEGWSSTSKLDIVLTLMRTGWVNRKAPKSAYKPGQAKHFRNDFHRPSSYFACLVEHVKLFEKGVPQIAHNLKAR